jgi:shikimate kinase
MRAKNNIALIGFMACGKTAVGRELARWIGYRFVDSDREVERAITGPIASFFQGAGEDRFRQAEARILARVLAGSRQVIACGGGVVETPENVAKIREKATTVWLKVSLDDARARLEAEGGRPLYARMTPDEFAALYERRQEMYEFADVHIDTTGMDVRRVAQLVLHTLY